MYNSLVYSLIAEQVSLIIAYIKFTVKYLHAVKFYMTYVHMRKRFTSESVFILYCSYRRLLSDTNCCNNRRCCVRV
jgi:hypothetical protein